MIAIRNAEIKSWSRNGNFTPSHLASGLVLIKRCILMSTLFFFFYLFWSRFSLLPNHAAVPADWRVPKRLFSLCCGRASSWREKKTTNRSKLRAATCPQWSRLTATHPSYNFKSASVFRWSLAWFARSVTVKTNAKVMLTEQWLTVAEMTSTLSTC